MHIKYSKMFKHPYMSSINKEKMCIVGLIGCSFMRGMLIGLYLGNK